MELRVTRSMHFKIVKETILQHNSKLSQNFDVSRIITVTNEARKQPPERQHYKKKDAELNNPRKQEENKSSEKSNENYGSNKEKIAHQKKVIYQQTKITKVFKS